MWISELDIRGFKHLRGRYRFGAGLTLVTGPNESGKSTLHEAVARSLFGFSAAERRRRNGVSERDRRRPWGGGPYGLTAVMQEALGKTLHVDLDLERHALVVSDADTGADLSAHARGRREEIALGQWLLGLELDDFRQVCCLEQAAVDRVARSESLVLALQRSVETGSQDVGVEDAQERLRAYLGRLGIHAGHYGALPSGALTRLRAERAAAASALATSEAVREQVTELAVELERTRRQGDDARRGMATVRQRLLLSEQTLLAERLARAEQLSAEATPRMEPAREVAEPRRIAVEAARDGLARSGERTRELQAEAGAAQGQIDALSARLREASTRVDALEPYAGVDTSAQADIRTLQARLAELEGAVAEPAPAPAPEGDPLLARYRRERDLLAVLERAPAGPLQRRPLLAALGLAAVASVVAGALLHPVFLAGVPLVLAAAVALSRRRPASDDGLEAALSGYGGRSLAELDRLVADEDAALAAAAALAAEHERRIAGARARLATAASELQARLDAAGQPPAAPTERSAAYIAACRRCEELAAARGELAQAQAGLERAEAPRRELRRLEERRRQEQEQLLADYAAEGIAETDPERARAAFDELVRRGAAWRQERERVERVRAALAELLESASLAELRERAAAAGARLREHVAANGELAAAGGDADALREQLEGLRRQASAADVAAGQLETQIAERESRVEPPAELRERCSRFDQRIDAIERAAEAVKLARNQLDVAARETHRAFAPHLRAALEDDLPRITAGRYHAAAVDEDLAIRVVAPESGGFVDVADLSRGTQDQIYLVERLCIARLLDPTTGQAPLMLDDPFAHFDEARLRLGLELVREVAATRQVILFSEDPDLVALAHELCGECSTIELPAPVAVAESAQVA